MKPPRYTDNVARFANVDIYKTDLKATFARVRREQRQAEQVEQARQEQIAREATTKVRSITRRKQA